MKINEGIHVEEAGFCMLCHSEGKLLYQDLRDRLFGAPGIWSLMRCPKCGLVWLNPRPIPEDIGKLYETYHTHSASNQVPKLAILRRLIRNSILATRLGYTELVDGSFQRMLGRFFSWITPIREMAELSVMCLNRQKRGKLLDVGCGSGAFLAKIKELGWDVVGVEPDRQAVKVAREHFGLNVYEGMLEEVGFPDNEFNAITMSHVIEHLYNPVSTLKECYRILKPGGRLVIITPNVESLGARLFREAWRGWEPPRHLYLFSPSTLQTLTKKAGLKVIQIRTTARSARWMWAASHLIHHNDILPGGSPQKVAPGLRLAGVAFQVMEHGLCIIRNVGEELIMLATK